MKTKPVTSPEQPKPGQPTAVTPKASGAKQVDIGRHSAFCTICKHPERQEIERKFLAWVGPADIAEEYGLGDRVTVYRHGVAFGLYDRRRRNVRAALEHIIEKAGRVDVNASAVVAAVQAYAKINAAGEWIDRTETVNLNQLFERMSIAQKEAYARDGKLPDWFTSIVGPQPETDAVGGEMRATAQEGGESINGEQAAR